MSTNNSEITDKQREAMNSMWDEVNHSQGAPATRKVNYVHRADHDPYLVPCVHCGVKTSLSRSDYHEKKTVYKCPSCGKTNVISIRKPLFVRLFNLLIYVLGVILFLAIVCSVLISYGVFSV